MFNYICLGKYLSVWRKKLHILLGAIVFGLVKACPSNSNRFTSKSFTLATYKIIHYFYFNTYIVGDAKYFTSNNVLLIFSPNTIIPNHHFTKTHAL